ncbi:MAG: hypothetical protein RL661_313 [Pseudomonadota bacterium]
MSLINDVLKSFLTENNNANSAQTGQGDVLITAAMVMLDKAGGIQGVMEKFQKSGLGDVVASWVGTGQNQSITPDQITQALGQENIQVITQEVNIPAEQSGNLLSELLPVLIDQLTPNGQVPDQNQMANLGKTVLASVLKSGILSGKSSA